ncbi:MAG: hypothetical protein JO007_06305 [Alphaproteobacteria bacterium]|nr:hypothetical protein [Alphaproteobacteria bacterium]
MASANPEKSNEALYPVIAESTTSTEFSGAVRALNQIPSEDSTTIRAQLPVQIEWLDTIEGALCELRRRNIADPNLAAAATIVSRLRTVISSRQEHITADKALWLGLFLCVSELLKHFSSAIGDDLGHATAHKIIEVLASLSQYLKV